MGFMISSTDYAEFVKRTYAYIHAQKDYITALDSATGDGDHWVNMDMGFERLTKQTDQFLSMPIDRVFQEMGKTMMAVIGGSSGVLYGSAYLAAARAVKGKDTLDVNSLCDALAAMLEAIISRGQSKEGFKTMIDSLAPAVKTYRQALAEHKSEKELCLAVKQAAIDGAENTKNMEAVRGRASYQENKGVGHLDPGAVTMSYQISIMMDYIIETL
ncbi:dihydroxyacetone kinase subunit L [Lacrimispora sp. NSJ-141]|uniref:phosphoenolpyruvate--glycerone phosphotransferase n=1 Tax=Lientehia hominis TaxID=2897778 RepID=A0AAP2RKJ9_9FIRM|nr:dihydroxyacetone kinase subunit DhaL [Lientehia hominis]MCD2493219.1 dihydroxyacetone kinase subunit L [Lientehia hominis]